MRNTRISRKLRLMHTLGGRGRDDGQGICATEDCATLNDDSNKSRPTARLLPIAPTSGRWHLVTLTAGGQTQSFALPASGRVLASGCPVDECDDDPT